MNQKNHGALEMKIITALFILLIQNQILGSFEGAACSRAMTPWIKKMSSSLSIDKKKGVGFSIKNGSKIQMHYINQMFPYKIRSYEGNPEKKISIYESNIKDKGYVFDFTNEKHGRLKEKKENENYTHFKLEPIKNIESSPYLLFFERVHIFNKGNKFTSFEKATMESCLGALLASNSKDKMNIEKMVNKLKLSNKNVQKVAGKNKAIPEETKKNSSNSQSQ
jgi:hypothetical protein